MSGSVDVFMFVIVILNLAILSSSRLADCIHIVALQGVLVGLLSLVVQDSAITFRLILIAAVAVTLKGVIFPRLLFKAIREADVGREVQPIVSYPISTLAGTLFFAVSLWISSRLPIPESRFLYFAIPVTFSSILVGLFIIVTRVKALTQVLGYLVLENGIYAFGVVLLVENPVLVEFGMLLDVFVAVFVMGIIIFHINREFDHIDTHLLSRLEDWRSRRPEGEA